jgi:predicted small lipoprotein YifL
MKPILKHLVVLVFLLMSLAVLAGCMLMMPAMMPPDMLKTSHSKNQGQEQMIEEAVSEMILNRGSYSLVELGRVETDNRAFSEKMLREVIVNQIAASGQMVLTGPGQEQAAAAGSTNEDQHVRAILDAELLRLESQDRLELKLIDAQSGRIVWEKRYYSLQPSSASSHAH